MAKKGIHPTCHKVSLMSAAKAVAFMDMALGLFGLVWFVVMLARYDVISLDPFGFDYVTAASTSTSSDASKIPDLGIMMEAVDLSPAKGHSPRVDARHKYISLSLAAFYTAVNLMVFVLLLVGIYKRSPGRCLEWFHIRCAVFFFKLIILVMFLMGGEVVQHIYHHVPFLISMLLHLYGMWVVSSFAGELRALRLQEQIERCRKQWELDMMERQNSITEMGTGLELVLQRRVLDEQIKRNIFNF